MAVKIVNVIYCDEKRRGVGHTDDDPVRAIIQLWTMDGKLILEHDIHTGETHVELTHLSDLAGDEG